MEGRGHLILTDSKIRHQLIISIVSKQDRVELIETKWFALLDKYVEQTKIKFDLIKDVAKFN